MNQETKTIDITPVGCQTPEGSEKVEATMKACEITAAELANATMQFCNEHGPDVLDCMEMYLEACEDFRHLITLSQDRAKAIEAFLRAVAGR